MNFLDVRADEDGTRYCYATLPGVESTSVLSSVETYRQGPRATVGEAAHSRQRRIDSWRSITPKGNS